MNRFFAFTLGAFLLFSVNAFAQSEICNNNLDDDGDGLIDCNDPDCQFGANIEEGCNCFDNVDNDGDGQIDENDPNCTKYFGLEFIGEGSDCSLDPPAGSDVFDSIGNVQVKSGQNTVDTQSKMAIGDVDGDGMPDAVTTSKYNKTLRVINTVTGVTKSEFSAPSNSPNGYFPDNNNKHYMELEVSIADIDGDDISEIYTIVSYREGVNDPATKFYLLGFRYTPDVLIPLFSSPVSLGTQRPGSIGITDFDGDGLAELYVRNMIIAAENGAILANPGGNWQTEVNSGSVAVNIDKSSANQELVCGKIIYTVPNLSARTTQTLTVWKNLDSTHPNYYYPKVVAGVPEYGTVNFSTTSVADINEDGNIDVVLSGATGNNTGPTSVFYWDVTQNIATHYSPPDTTAAAGGGGVNGWPWGTSRVNIGEIDGDGRLELTFTAGTRLWALDVANDGTLTTAWPWPYYRALKDAKSGIVANTVYDFNNDGAPELVYRDSKQMVIVNGADGGLSGTGTQTELKAFTCQSHTFTEGPIIADVNGDGATDICVPCNRSDNESAFNIDAQIQQQALGEIRLYYSSANDWLPTRQVWNQAGYFVIHIKDDLTVPRTQMDMTTVFGTGACPNGIPGPQQPFNTFLNQVPTLGPNGCPVFPAPDITFAGDDPNDPSVDPTSPDYFPAVKFTPPTCGDLGISVEFNIVNNGSLTISDDIPVTFYLNNPVDAAADASYILHSLTLPVTNFEVGDTLSFGPYSFNGPGTTFTLYASLNDDGSALPLDTTRTSTECKLGNNIYSVLIDPQPFDVAIEIISDNNKCTDSAPDQGELKAVVTKDGVVVTDYSKYAFQWYVGEVPDTVRIAAPDGTGDRLFSVSDTTRYTLIVTNTEKGCSSNPIDTLITRAQPEVFVNFNEISRQTQCFPYNGELEVFLTDVNGAAVDPTGYTFSWFVTNFSNPLGIVGRVGDNLVAAEYLVTAEKNGCTYQGSYTLLGPTLPTVSASLLQGVFSCTTPTSGSVTAVAEINGVVQDTLDYEFEWYFWDDVNLQIGSLISATDKNATRKELAAGWYAVVAKDIATQCSSTPPIAIEVTDERIFPVAIITEVAPQTSCDDNQPNGILEANVFDPNDLATPLDPALFNFEWFQGDNTLPANAHTTVSGTNGKIAEQVAGGGIPYTVRVSYIASGCAHDTIFVISEDKNFPVVTGTTQPNSVCNDALASQQYTGSIDLDITFDGVAVNDLTGYTVDWFHGTDTNIADSLIVSNSSFTLTGLKDGYYSVLVTKNDVHCTSTPVDFQVLNQTVQPIVNLALTPETTCSGTPNGAISATIDETAQGGGAAVTSGYTFAWYSGNDTLAANALGVTTATLSGIEGGANYTVLVTNTLTGCQRVQSTFLADESELPTLVLTPTNNTVCDPSLTNPAISFNGEIAVAVTDANALGTDTYTYNLYLASDNATVIATNATGTFTTLDGEDYLVTATNDRLGCTSAFTPITVNTVPAALSATIATTPETTCFDAGAGTPNGEVVVTPSGGTGSFSYEWYAGNTASGTPISSSATASGLDGGTGIEYTVLITDLGSGCQLTATSALNDASSVPVLTLTPTNNTICDPTLTNPAIDFNGTISVAVADANALGADTYTYNLYLASDNATVIQTNATGTFIELDGEDYLVTATNNRLGCTSVFTPITVNTVPAALSATIATTPETTCFDAGAGTPNGEVVVTPSGGTGSFSYEWYAGNAVSGTPISSSATASGLDGGTGFEYTVLITDLGSGCQLTATSALNDASSVPVLTLTPTNNTICDPALTNPVLTFNGEISVAVADANALGGDTYTYNLYLASDNTAAIQTNTTGTFTELDGEDYLVTVTNDRLGCTSVFTPITVNTVPAPLAVSIDAIDETTCDGVSPANGSATANPSGGSGNYAFDWFTGNTAGAFGAGFTDVAQAIELEGTGNLEYTVLITDLESGCQVTATTTINDISAVPALSFTVAPNTICDIAVAGAYDGSITSTVTDVNAEAGDVYEYKLYLQSNLTTALQTNATGIFSGLDGEDYAVTVRNTRLGCESDPINVTVNEVIVLPDVNIAITNQTSCDPALPNGVLAATIDESGSGGSANETSGYTINWYTGNDISTGTLVSTTTATNGEVNALVGNVFYSVEVINQATGCASTQSVFLPEELTIPEVSVSATDITGCIDASKGFLTPSIDINGVDLPAADYADYNFVWYRGQDDSGAELITTDGANNGGILDEAALGSDIFSDYYTVKAVHKTNHCESNTAFDFVAPPAAPLFNITFPAESRPSFCGNPNGSITASVAPGGTYTFQWFAGGPTNSPPANFYTDPVIEFGTEETDVSSTATTSTVNNIIDGIYTVVVTNTTTGCKEYATYNLLYNGAHLFQTVNHYDNTVCSPGPYDGVIWGVIDPTSTIETSPGVFRPVSDYTFYLYKSANVTLDKNDPTADPSYVDSKVASVTDSTAFFNLEPGTYTLVARQDFGPDFCFASPQLVTIEDLPRDPIIFVSEIQPNRSCDSPGTGSFNFKILKDPQDQITSPTYDIIVTRLSNNTTVNTYNGVGENVVILEDELVDGQYRIDATSSSGCSISRTITINRSPVVPVLDEDLITIVPDDDCNTAPFAGSIEIDIAAIATSDPSFPLPGGTDVDDFNFAWFIGSSFATANPIYNANGIVGNPAGGQVLDGSKPGYAGAGTYWVVITNRATGASPGALCSSAPVPIVIPDTKVDPFVFLIAEANNNCSGASNGVIAAFATTSGVVTAGGYDYELMPGNVAPTRFANDTAYFEALNPGTYTINVIDLDKSCTTSGTIEVEDKPLPPNNLDITADITDVADCNPSGAITIVYGTETDATDFDIAWYDDEATALADFAALSTASAIQSGSATTESTYANRAPGTYYYILTKTSGEGVGCLSAVFNATVRDISVDPTLTLTPFANTNCDAPFDGRIEALAFTSGVATAGGYEYTLLIAGAVDSVNNTGIFIGLDPGDYTVQVRDLDTDCTFQANTTIEDQPITPTDIDYTIAVTDVADCTASGALQITFGAGADPNEFDVFWYASQANAEAGTSPLNGGPANVATNLLLDGQLAGTYFYVFTKTAGVGTGCFSAVFNETIRDISVDPTLTLTPFANTNCDAPFDGRIEALALTSGVATAGGYEYTLLIAGAVDSVNNTGIFIGLDPGDYTVQVRDLDTQCTFQANTTIEDQPITPTDIDYSIAVTDVADCTPSGALQITFGAGADPNEFDVFWYASQADAEAGTTPLKGGPANVATNLLLDGQLAGTYFYVFTKTAGVGTGCFSAVFNETIRDVSVDPAASISVKANTSCDNLQPNGEITVVASTNGVPAAGGYNYTLVETGETNTTGLFSDLVEGSYSILVEDIDTQCTQTFTATIELQPIKPANLALDIVVNDQPNCNPSGSIVVNYPDVALTDPSEYIIAWFNTLAEAEAFAANPLDLNDTLRHGEANIAFNSMLHTAGSLEIFAGTYYFVFQKISGEGAGCTSAIFNETIQELSSTPTMTFEVSPNTICGGSQPDGVVTVTPRERDGSVGTYSFAWSYDGDTPGLFTDPGDVAVYTEATDGFYTVTVTNTLTGCSSTSTVEVILDESISVPNIIEVLVTDPLDCNPTGIAEVTRLSIGGTIFLSKANGDDLDTDYDYLWFNGDPNDPATELVTDPISGLPITSSVITGLGLGTYFVQVVSSVTECESIYKQIEVVGDDIIYPGGFIELTYPQISCDPANGLAILTAFGYEGSDQSANTDTYAFTWFFEEADGTLTEIVPNGNTTITNTSNSSELANIYNGTYWVNILNTNTNCTNDLFFILEDQSDEFRPQVSVSSTPVDRCTPGDNGISDNGSLSANVVNAIDGHSFAYTWYYHGDTPNENFNYATATPFANTAIVQNVPVGFYAVIVQDLITTCNNEPPVIVEVKDERNFPELKIREIQPMTNCEITSANGQLEATADGVVAGYTFEWFAGTIDNFDDSTPLLLPNGQIARHQLIGQRAGSYVVRVTDNYSGCYSEQMGTITDETILPESPTAIIEANRTNCVEPNGIITANVEGNNTDYFFDWYQGESVASGTFVFRGQTLRGADIGPYTVTATNMVTGCVSAEATVTIADERILPEFEFYTIPSHCENPTGYMEFTVLNNSVIENVEWTNVETGEVVGSGVFVNNVLPGLYEARMVTFEGCEITGQVTVGTEITEYNGISANGDGINDFFQIDCISLFPNNNVKIFNRAGTLVFEIDNYNNLDRAFEGIGVKGVYPTGRVLPAGTYFYIIDKRDGSRPETGYLELAR